MKTNKCPRPFVKWAGGKRQIIDVLYAHVPDEFSEYYEPFVGGGALFFKLWNEGRIKYAHLNDLNSDLINTYRIIRDRPSELIDELKCGKYRNVKDVYYKIRADEPQDPVLRAARFIYLNKTAFNGLYRVNSSGKFNVPFGRYKNPKICDEENILKVSESLKHVKLTTEDFSFVTKYAKKNDFIYFDPPYHPISETSQFTSYTKLSFTKEDQIRLSNVYHELSDRGTFVMLSNSTAPLVMDLYSNYNTIKVNARRAINCRPDKRGQISEIVALNYGGSF